jgi:hypothetical protein
MPAAKYSTQVAGDRSELNSWSLPALPFGIPQRILAWIVGVSLPVVLYGGIQAFYFQGSFLAPIAYVTDERPSGEAFAKLLAVPADALLTGIHLFHDFAISYYWGGLGNPWFDNQYPFWPNHTPLAMLLGRAFTVMPYGLASQVLAMVMLGSVAVMMLLATRGKPWSLKVLATGIIVLAGPSIGAVDRGNYQGLMPILLFAFAVLALRNKWGWAMVPLVLAASLKVYPVVILLLLVAERRWKPLIGAVVGGALLNGVLLFAFRGNPIDTAREYLHYLSPILGLEGNDFLIYNVSPVAGIAHWLLLAGLDGFAGQVLRFDTIIVILFFAAAAPLLWARTALLPQTRVVIALMLTVLITPVVFPYTMNWALAAAAVLIACAATSPLLALPASFSTARVRMQLFTICAGVGAVSAFLPLLVPRSYESGYPAGVATLISPIAVGTVIVGCWLAILQPRLATSRTRMPDSP